MLDLSARRPSDAWFTLFLDPSNFTPLALAYGSTMVLFGLVLLLVPEIATHPSFAELAPARVLWGSVMVVVGGLQLVLLRPGFQRWLFLASIGAMFLWLWISIAFLLSNGHVTTAQAAYVPAAMSCAWLAFRTSPIRR